MSRVEKNVEGNEISCFSINLILSIFPAIKFTQKRQQQKSLSVLSHAVIVGLKLCPVMITVKIISTLQGQIARSPVIVRSPLNGGQECQISV